MQSGELTLPNRVVMTTVKLAYSNKKEEVNNRQIGFCNDVPKAESG
jgi:2,4-dienoyl-CoA reductase-like NADH-dependent reductase (Old Yellow Enzyme family)